MFISEDKVLTNDVELPRFAGMLADCVRRLPRSKTLAWVQPLDSNLSITLEEAEQMMGAFGSVTLLEKNELTDGRPCYIVAAVFRPKLLALCLRWQKKDIEQRPSALIHLLSGLSHFPINLFEIPSDEDLSPDWQAGISKIIEELGRPSSNGCVIGAFIPDLTQGSAHYRRGMRVLAELAYGAQIRRTVECQWIGGIKTVHDARLAHAFALEHGICFDFSLSHSTDEGICPYPKDGAYFPLSFDFRAPASFPSSKDPIEIPRTDPLINKGTFIKEPLPRWRDLRKISQSFEGDQQGIQSRLELSLNRERRAEYLKQLEGDKVKVGEWHKYHVYNWAPPAKKLLRIMHLDTAALKSGYYSPRWLKTVKACLLRLCLLRSRITLCKASELLNFAREQARDRAADRHSLIQFQTASHAYLAEGRQELTADGKALIQELPEGLGTTLEIGSDMASPQAWLSRGPRATWGLTFVIHPWRLSLQRGFTV